MDPPGTLYLRAAPPPPGGFHSSILPVQHGVGNPFWTPLPLDGSIPLSNYPDYHAKHSPTHVFAVWEPPLSSSTSSGFDRRGKITQLEYAHAVHRCGRILLDAGLPFAQSREDARPVAVISAGDGFTTQLAHFAVLRTGHYFFAISPRLPPNVIAQMLAVQRCEYVIAAPTMGEAIKKEHEQLDGDNLELQLIPSPDGRKLFAMRDGKDEVLVEPEWLPELGERTQDDICVVLHSGGTTGLPKAIPWTHQYVSGLSRIWWHSGDDMCDRVGTIGAMPPFHMMGVFNGMMVTMTTGLTAGLFRPLEPAIPTPDAVMRNMKRTHSNALFIVPVFLEGWAKDPDAVGYLASLDVVWYGGGAISQGGAGEALVKAGVNLRMVYGSTEQGVPSQLVTYRSPAGQHCWDGIKFSSHIDLKLIPHDNENYEPVILVNEGCSPAFFNVPGQEAYATNDLIARHPDHPDWWKITGRVDDWIVLSTGEKTAPAVMERTIAGHPLVARAVMFGRGRPLHGILLEPVPESAFDPRDDAKLIEFRNAVWAAVELANSSAADYSRIFKEMIIVSSPDRPFLMTDKSTVKRNPTLELYEKEIDLLYKAMQGDDLPPPTELTPESTREYIRGLASRLLGDDVPVLHDHEDIFRHGVDSLGAIRLRNSILTTLHRHKVNSSRLSPDFVYQYPSVATLTALVLALAHGEAGIDTSSPGYRAQAMRREITTRVDRLPARPNDAVFHSPEKHVVVLTGTTGGLGSQLLIQLLGRDDVGVVYALNRRSSGSSLPGRQAAALVERCGYSPDEAMILLTNERLRLLEADLGHETLGLSSETYEEIRWTATLLIPNAWRVDFNIPLSSFSPQLDSVCALARLARLSPLRTPPRIVFPSSVAAVAGWREGAALTMSDDPMKEISANSVGCLSVRPTRRARKGAAEAFAPESAQERAPRVRRGLGLFSRTPRPMLEYPTTPASAIAALPAIGWKGWKVPEMPIKDLSVAVGYGYGEGKAVAEKVLEKANVGAVVVRIGQLSGSLCTGAWSVTEWLPLLIRAGQKIGALPDKDGDVPWMGIDTAAAVLLDVAFSSTPPSSSVAHIVHPHPVRWHDLFFAFACALSLPLIPYSLWLARLGQAASVPGSERENPAVKLLSFYCVIGAAAGEGRDAMGGPMLDTEKTQAVSATLATAPQLDGRDVRSWVDYWRKVGFLS